MELIQLAVPVLFKGLGMTLTLTAISVAIGFNLGLGLAIMRGSDNSWGPGSRAITVSRFAARHFWCRYS
jgi:octopine/nopaline transport system permease protein